MSQISCRAFFFAPFSRVSQKEQIGRPFPPFFSRFPHVKKKIKNKKRHWAVPSSSRKEAPFWSLRLQNDATPADFTVVRLVCRHSPSRFCCGLWC